MNENNECIKIGSTHTEGREREGAPDLPALGRTASVGPAVLHQVIIISILLSLTQTLLYLP